MTRHVVPQEVHCKLRSSAGSADTEDSIWYRSSMSVIEQPRSEEYRERQHCNSATVKRLWDIKIYGDHIDWIRFGMIIWGRPLVPFRVIRKDIIQMITIIMKLNSRSFCPWKDHNQLTLGASVLYQPAMDLQQYGHWWSVMRPTWEKTQKLSFTDDDQCI